MALKSLPVAAGILGGMSLMHPRQLHSLPPFLAVAPAPCAAGCCGRGGSQLPSLVLGSRPTPPQGLAHEGPSQAAAPKPPWDSAAVPKLPGVPNPGPAEATVGLFNEYRPFRPPVWP